MVGEFWPRIVSDLPIRGLVESSVGWVGPQDSPTRSVVAGLPVSEYSSRPTLGVPELKYRG